MYLSYNVMICRRIYCTQGLYCIQPAHYGYDGIPGSTPLLNMLCLASSPFDTDPSVSSVFLSAPLSCAASLWQFLVNPLARARVARVLQELSADDAADDAHAGYMERKASGNRQLLTATLSQAGVPELVLARLLRACQLVGAGFRIQGSESQPTLFSYSPLISSLFINANLGAQRWCVNSNSNSKNCRDCRPDCATTGSWWTPSEAVRC